MSLRKDTKYMHEKGWEPSVPSKAELQKQAEYLNKHAMSSGNMASDLGNSIGGENGLKNFKLTSINGIYEMSGTKDPNTIIVYRKDGKAFKGSEIIPNEIYPGGLMLAMMESGNQNSKKFTAKRTLSDDRKNLIITIIFEKGNDNPEIEKKDSRGNIVTKVLKPFFKH